MYFVCFSDNVPHDFELHLEVYALNQSLAVSTAGKDFADRYSYFSLHGSPRFGRKKPTNEPKASDQPQSKFVLIAQATYTKKSVHKLAKARFLKTERAPENPLMQLPVENSFISRFVIQPQCYTRPVTFSGIVETNHVPYACVLAAGFFNGEEIMRYDYSDQRTFSVPIASVGIKGKKMNLFYLMSFY